MAVFGIGLFDACPSRDAGWSRAGRCGQALNKPRRRKPRGAAMVVGRSAAYGDLMPSPTVAMVPIRD